MASSKMGGVGSGDVIFIMQWRRGEGRGGAASPAAMEMQRDKMASLDSKITLLH